MRIKYALLSIILFAFSSDLLVQGTENNSSEIFTKVLDNNNTKIIECGVRIQYKSKKSLDEIYRKTIEKINRTGIVEFKEYKPSYFEISYNENGVTNEIVASEENNTTILSATSTAETAIDKRSILKQQLQKVLYDVSIDVQYFSYVKGKIITDSIKNNIELTERTLVKCGATDVNTIKLNSGFTGVAKLKDNSTVNYAISENDKETYLIIGTPIIFITY